MAGYMLWGKFRADRLTGKKFWEFGDFNFVVRAVAVLVIAWIGFTLISPEPHFDSASKQIQFGKETRQPWLVEKAIEKELAKDPLNPDLNYGLLKAHFDNENASLTEKENLVYQEQGRRIFNYYNDLALQNDPAKSDIGNLFLAMWYVEQEHINEETFDNATFHIRQVKNPTQKYLDYITGRAILRGIGPVAAEPYFISEIKNNGFKSGAYEQLAWIYDAMGRSEELEKLVAGPESRSSVPSSLRYRVYFLGGNIGAFYLLHFANMFGTLPLWGILGALLILFTWLFFLRKLSFLAPVRWLHFILAVGIGAFLAMLSWLLYEFYHDILFFDTNGETANDFLYCFLGIGLIEELVKLIPFLVILRFTKIIRKPVDYLLIASAAGLGFAFFENLLYISQYGLDVIHARALTSSVSHMATSAIVAYGFVLVRYRYPQHWWIVPVFFLAAVLAHGFYDFWLMNEKMRSLSIVTLFFYLTEILVYVSFLNNALNQTADPLQPGKSFALNTQRLASFIAGALVLVFAIEYAGTCLVYGTSTGNHTLLGSFISGGYLVFFLSVRLSNIDIVPGEWGKIEFFAGLLPSDLLGSSRKKNFNSVIGLRLQFRPDESTGNFSSHLPLAGIVLRRLTIKGYSGWFELRPETPVTIATLAHERLYFRAKEETELVRENEPVTVGIYIRVSDTENPRSSKLIFVDWAVAE
jgi:protease PrsW